MKRALLLAKNGEGRVSPNPMVGAVIVARDRIIGEGFHANFGGPHAEVNAIASVKSADIHLLKEATIYVTLEPCAHFGKTPPCANLIVSTGIPKVVIAALDPNPLVAGKGVRILEEAGIEVVAGVLRKESEWLNRRFFTSHTSGRPWILLKWAQSADGFMAAFDDSARPKPVKLSSPLSTVWMHRQRANVDAIMVGANTEAIDSPRLTVREWGGKNPKKIVAHRAFPLQSVLSKLHGEGISSIMVEGGPTLLQSFINERLFDEIRIEISPAILKNGLHAPALPTDLTLVFTDVCEKHTILTYRR